MADGEHLGPQTRHLWLSERSKPLEGTAKHPQGRLFAPVGQYRGDPMALHPANWLKQSDTPAHDDIISWHSSEESSLPRSDDYEHRQLEEGHGSTDWGPPEEYRDGVWPRGYGRDFTVDSKERPMGEYGSVVGMHFGDVAAGQERAPRSYIHPARIPKSTLADPPKGTFAFEKEGGAIVGGPYRSQRMIVNAETGDATPDTRWGDSAANYAEKGTDLVEKGKTLAYRNDVEAKGSTSYRTLPETARTWSEDVMNARSPKADRFDPATGGLTGKVASKYGWHDDPHAFRNEPHPALVHLAEKGYDPVIRSYYDKPKADRDSVQMSFGDLARSQGSRQAGELGNTDSLENIARQKASMQAADRMGHFNAGRNWSLRKPDQPLDR